MYEIILINIGIFQTYILENIKNLQLFKNNNITIIADIHIIPNFKTINNLNIIDTKDININSFFVKNKNNKIFRNGFWTHTSARLFYLYHYIKNNNKIKCFHIENDMMIYINLNKLILNNKLYITMDNQNRCIPGIIYIPNHKKLHNLIINYDYKKNDMENMAIFFNNNKQICDTFPIIKTNKHHPKHDIYSQNFDIFNCIFDAAAIGQYLGGIDPRNTTLKTTIGFINETCVVDYSKYNFYWRKYNDIYIPCIQIDGKLIRIINLHIHCKKLCNFMANTPIQNKFIKKYEIEC